MKRILTVFLTPVLALCAAALPCAARDASASEIEEILKGLSEITGLRPLKQVKSETMDKEQLKRYIDDRMKEAVKPEQIRAEELTLKKFGLVPQDFDLRGNTVDLLTEQAAAFYDFRKKRLFLVSSTAGTGIPQQTALVHELAHALADQHFNLAKFIKRGASSDEESLARMAVMEGQASWLMSEYMLRKSGRSLKDTPEAVEMMTNTEVSAGQFPVLERTPLYLRETLLFPYTRGMLFQHQVYERLGQGGFSEVFRTPPIDTQQVLHPEKYFGHVQPSHPHAPEVPDRGHYRSLADGEVGELDHQVLLRQYIGAKEAGPLSSQWKGGRYELLENKHDKRTVLAYAVEFAGEDAARQYFAAYQRILRGKWKSMEVRESSPDSVSGLGDDGEFRLKRNGALVTSVEGLPPAPAPAGRTPSAPLALQ